MRLKDAISDNLRNYFHLNELWMDYDDYRAKYKKEFELNEGLIVTHEINKSISVIENNGYDVIVVDGEKYRNRFFVEINSEDGNFEKLFKITNNLGWFCAQIRGNTKYGPDSVKYTSTNLSKYRREYDTLLLLFEPKYDLPITPNIDYLYHFTWKSNWSRIQKQGLSPRTTNKVTTHPERVYLALSLSAAEKFARRIENKIKPEPDPKHQFSIDSITGVILKIDASELPPYVKLYADPNFHKEGCYTLNTIPSKCIRLYKTLD